MPSVRSVVRTVAAAGLTIGLVAAAAAPASAMAVGQPLCGSNNVSRLVYVCVEEVTDGPRIPVATVLSVATNPVAVADVAGYLVSYRVPTGPDSFADIPCVVLVNNGGTTDECANLGLTPTPNRVPITLYHQVASSYSPTVTTLTNLYICEASVTATADGFGITNQILPTLCYDGPASTVTDALTDTLFRPRD